MTQTYKFKPKAFSKCANCADCQQNQPEAKESGHGARSERLEGGHAVCVLGEQVMMAPKRVRIELSPQLYEDQLRNPDLHPSFEHNRYFMLNRYSRSNNIFAMYEYRSATIWLNGSIIVDRVMKSNLIETFNLKVEFEIQLRFSSKYLIT